MDGSRTTYILRVWHDAPVAMQEAGFFCSLQVPATEEIFYFSSLEAVLEFVRARSQRARPPK